MTRGSLFTLAMCVWILCEATAAGQGMGGGVGGGGRGHGGGGGSKGSDRQKAASDYYRGAVPPSQRILTPHGGEFLANEPDHYEIVYMPLQTRIYLFDDKMKPLTARDVHVQMSLTLPSESSPRRILFQYIAMPEGKAEQDYVVAVFDMRQLTDRETPITFEFSGLSDRRHPTASFTPQFSPSKIRPYVARVLLTAADRDGVMRQKVCPVSGHVLGVKGPIIKLYLADYPLYLSGEDGIAAVQESPEKFLPHPVASNPGP